MTDIRKDIWTLYPFVKHRLAPFQAPAPTPWETTLEDPDVGTVRLTGQLRGDPDARELVVIVHGLGGTTDSYYCMRAAAAVAEIGGASLCLSLRGSDRRGEDFYNIALHADLQAAVASPRLARYERIFILGYSMGGYVTWHFARGPADPRVKAVAAVCTPIDLLTAQRYIDGARAWIYRHHVLNGLKAIYRAVAEKGHAVPSDPREVQRVRTMYDWDRLAIAPRYGYESPEHYYQDLSIKPHLDAFAVPALLVAGMHDPIVPPQTIRPFVEQRSGGDARSLEVHWVRRGGHVAFPRDLDLGFGPRRGLEGQIYGWFLGHG